MAAEREIWIIFDGECPFCSAYVRLARLREAAGRVYLLNAREPHPLVEEAIKAGYNLDDGMALKVGDTIYHGDSCVHQLALMSSGSGAFNRLNYWIFKSPRRTKVLYPILRHFRNLTLRILGRKRIHASAISAHEGRSV
jgi:predicted DCC family thiol-disulfide oxidoreductase YuxK